MRRRIFYPLLIGGLLTIFLIGEIGNLENIESTINDANITGYITNIIPEYNEVLVVDK